MTHKSICVTIDIMITMNIDEACDRITRFAQANGVDELRAVELMVQYYRQLSSPERAALVTFMDYTGSPVLDKQKIM